MSIQKRVLAIALAAALTAPFINGAVADPEGRGYGMGPGMGYGMGPGMGYGMGPGMMGYGMMGYGMGPGMMGYGMGPGVMGYGMGPGMMGYGMGPGMMGYGMMYRDDVDEKDVRTFVGRHLEMRGLTRLKVGNIDTSDDRVFKADIVTSKEEALAARVVIDRRTGIPLGFE